MLQVAQGSVGKPLPPNLNDNQRETDGVVEVIHLMDDGDTIDADTYMRDFSHQVLYQARCKPDGTPPSSRRPVTAPAASDYNASIIAPVSNFLSHRRHSTGSKERSQRSERSNRTPSAPENDQTKQRTTGNCVFEINTLTQQSNFPKQQCDVA